MHKSTLKVKDLPVKHLKIPPYPLHAHSAIICGATGCGKTEFILDLLEAEYRNFFTYIFIICPSLEHNKAYRREWLFDYTSIFLINPNDFGGLDKTLQVHYETLGKLDESQVLFIIDDCSAMKDINKKRNTLSEIAFSGRHANCSLWILTQKYNAILTDVREQIKWIALFFCKDRDSFDEALRENDVVPSEERQQMRQLLARHKHSKLILITEQPTSYKFII